MKYFDIPTNESSGEDCGIEVYYNYLKGARNELEFPYHDVITENYNAFLDYDLDKFKEMMKQLKGIQLKYRIDSYPVKSEYIASPACYSWVLLFQMLPII